MNSFFQPNIKQGELFLDDIDSKHCVRVLRKRIGDEIIVLDGNGGVHTCVINDDTILKCEFEIIKSEYFEKPDYFIHIAIAPTKNKERIEWFVEKATEIGVDEITFLNTERSERNSIKVERIIKKSASAFKQSDGLFFPKINTLIPFEDFLFGRDKEQLNYIAFADQSKDHIYLKDAPKNKKYCVLIGPEGDFTEDEYSMALARGCESISLGNKKLRTETAGLIACHTLNLINL